MRHQHIDAPCVPVAQVAVTLVFTHADALLGLFQPGADPRHVVPVLVEHQHVRAGRRLHNLGQAVELLGVHLVDVAVLVVDRPVGELGQLAHQSRGVAGHHRRAAALLVVLGKLQHLVALELVVGAAHRRRQLHHVVVRHHRRQAQVVARLHRQADVGQAVADGLVAARLYAAAHDDVVPLVCLEVGFAVSRHALSQPLALVNAVHLRPQVDEAVGCGRSRQPHNAPHARRAHAHRLESVALRTLEARELVDDQRVKGQMAAIQAHQPHETVAAYNIHVGLAF